LHSLAGSEYHFSPRCIDDAAVADLGRDEINLAACWCGDAALVQNGTSIRVRLEIVFACQEIGVVQVQRAGDKSTHIDARAGTDHHASRIDQKYFAVRLQLAKYLRGIAAQNLVQNSTAGARLEETRGFIGGDRKTLPVDDGIGRVDDQKLVAILQHAGRT
jgi:hypothetical protein